MSSHAIENRLSRGQSEIDREAQELIGQIQILRQLFPESGHKKKNDFDGDGAGSLLYLSRFQSSEQTESIDKKKKSSIDGHSSIVNTKSEEELAGDEVLVPKSMSIQAREKKRQYAMSLVTLASDPSRRKDLVENGCIEMLIELSNLDGNIA
jgi:hypothetical protein